MDLIQTVTVECAQYVWNKSGYLYISLLNNSDVAHRVFVIYEEWKQAINPLL